MSEGDCISCNEIDFGEGFEHVKSITISGKTIINKSYKYKDTTIKIEANKIISSS